MGKKPLFRTSTRSNELAVLLRKGLLPTLPLQKINWLGFIMTHNKRRKDSMSVTDVEFFFFYLQALVSYLSVKFRIRYILISGITVSVAF